MTLELELGLPVLNPTTISEYDQPVRQRNVVRVVTEAD